MFHNLFDDDFFAPFGRLDRVLRDGFFRPYGLEGTRVGFPRVNVYTRADGAVVTAELPGVPAEALEIEVLGNTLTLKGTRPNPASEGEKLLRQERSAGGFQKTIQLPFRVDPNQVEAQVAHGILTVRLTRPAEDRPRKIQVKVNG
jgi:HSP20 family protein